MLLEREEGRGRGRERNIDMREKHPSGAAMHTPQWGTEPKTWVCALSGIKPSTLQLDDAPTKLLRPGQHSKLLNVTLVECI